MTLESVAITESSSARGFCSCCGAKIMPYFYDNAVASQNQINQLISENFLTVKGAALFLPRGNGSSSSSAPRITRRRNKHTGDLQQHLQTMFTLLRPEDTIRLAVRLESAYTLRTRYMVIVSTNGRQDTEESVVLGMDFSDSDRTCTVGLVLPLWSDTLIHLDGDGGFSVSTVNRVHVFKPVSVQAMWSALQSLHKVCEVARCHNYYPGSLFLTWVSYYQSCVSSDQHCINEWNAMRDVQSHRADSPVLFTDVPTERERTERLIKTRLREIMMQKDLENVTSKEIRTELEMQMVCNLREFKEFIDNEMIVILGQMDSPTEIFDHVYLGSEWNASNLEELQNSGVRYILNVTREIDNFFPGLFEYHNIRVYDEEATNLLEYWNDTYKFISKAKKAGVKCLVHCKMGVSRSASTVIAYAMKEYGWDLERAFDHVKERRSVTKPNPSFMKQLEEYQGILLASKQRHNKLWRSHSDSDLSEGHEPLCKAPRSLDRSDPHNNSGPPSIQQMLGIAVLESLTNPQPVMGNTCIKSGELPSELAHEDPFLPPRSRQRAATVVPEQNMAKNSRNNLAVSEPVACRRHPPPSLHVLAPPLSPEEREGDTTPDLGVQSSHQVPEPKTDTVELAPDTPDQNDSYQVSQSLELCLESAVSKDEGNLPSPSTPEADSPSGAPSIPKLDSSDDNNNPNAADLGAADDSVNAGASRLSTDSIDFFSAREKFLCLSQDSQPRSFSEMTAVRPPQSRCSPPLDNPSEEADKCHAPSETNSDAVPHPPHHDNSVCVRHIVTELESISHTCSPPLARNSPQTATLEEVDEQMASAPHSPSDRPSGSVRRATEQLELILRQGQEVPRSPLPSPCLDCSEPQSFSDKPEGTAVLTCTETQKTTDGKVGDTKVLDDEDSDIIPDPSFSLYLEGSVSVEADQITLNPTLDPSSGSSSMLWLEGVTELETDVDDPLRPQFRLARSSEDLQKIQETLRELQAFLYEAGGLGVCTGQAEENQPLKGQWNSVDGEQRLEPKVPAVWQRAMEIEARIRQAGLTPPSLMKRSASLAKLDQLELSTNDLNNWDFHPATTGFHQPFSSLSTFHSLPLTHSHDDAHKKQRVLPQSPFTPDSAVHLIEADRTEGSAHLSPSCLQQMQVGGARPPEHTPVQPTISTSTRQQHVKTHPVRRFRKASDKKKTVTVLYNTM